MLFRRFKQHIKVNEDFDFSYLPQFFMGTEISTSTQADVNGSSWQIGFYDADGEVYFKKVKLGNGAVFSNLVRNYWWNGKEGEKKKEGYYSLIKFVKELEIEQKHINDLLDYVEDRYKAGEHWQLHELDKNIKLRIYGEVEEITIERLQKYFDDIYCDWIAADLKAVNNITCSCKCYLFRNCKGVVPQKLVINAIVDKITFHGIFDEVHIPEVVMEEKADFKKIIQNCYGYQKYSIFLYVQTLVIRNNPKVLYNLADYISGRYKINGGNSSRSIFDDLNKYLGSSYSAFNNDNWKLYKLNKNIKIVIEKPAMAFGAVKEISDYFSNVLVDNQQPKDIVCQYINKFQEQFGKHGLETDLVEGFVVTDDNLQLGEQKFNVLRSDRKIDQLAIKQKIVSQEFICFHETGKPVAIDKIVIDNGGDLRCVLQNAYYNGVDSGFFSLLRTAKELEIHSNHGGGNQVLADLADYIEGKYALNANWKQEELDKDMRININSGRYSVSRSVAQRLRNYFKDVSIDTIWTLLETENVIDQKCRNMYIFIDSKKASPKKLIINAKLMGSGNLILFNGADSEVHIPEIKIDEQGCFAAIIRNHWWNNKEGDEEKYGFYSLVQHVKTLTIRNNSEVLKDFADYVVGRYQIGNSNWKAQQLNEDIKVVIEGPGDAFLPVSRIESCFTDVAVDGRKPEEYLAAWDLWNNPDYKAFVNCFKAYGLVVDPPERRINATRELVLENCYDIRGPVGSIDSLTIRQKMGINSVVCFHDTSKPVVAKKIVIENNGGLGCVLQTAYYDGTDAGFFNMLETVKNLEIKNNQQAVEDLIDYSDGKYALHPKWETQALDKDIVIKIHHDSNAFSLDVARRLRSYFKNVSIDCIWTRLETENVIDQECEDQYVFTNCRNANPQKLIVNAKLGGNEILILFNDADGEVYIPEITIGEHGSFDAVVRNKWWNRKNGDERKYGYYSLVSHVETLIIQNNLGAACNLADYISEDYEIKQPWSIQQLDKKIRVRIENIDGIQSIPDAQNKVKKIKKIKEYFDDVIVQSCYFSFLDLGLRTTGLNNAMEAQSELTLVGDVYNVMSCKNVINALIIDQNLKTDQLICFHDTSRPVSIDKLVIRENGNPRNLIQNAYYSGGQYGFFSLLVKCKVLEIHENKQAAKDLADYVENKYELHPNWRVQELSKDMEIRISGGDPGLPLDTAQRLREYFSNVSVDAIQTELQTENVVDQECENWYVFTPSGQASPQKLTVNARLSGDETLILFEQANNEVQIPEITIGEHGSFASVVRNQWNNNKKGNKKKSRYYSLIHHTKAITIRDNPQAICDLASYIKGQYKAGSNWPYKELIGDIKVILERPGDDLEPVKEIARYFVSVSIDGRSLNGYVKHMAVKQLGEYWGTFKACFDEHGLPTERHENTVQATSTTDLTGQVCHVRGGNQGIRLLNVNQKLGENQFVCFHDVSAPVQVDRVCIGADGDLRSVVQNAYYDGKAAGFFNLLETAGELEIRNIQAVRDIVDYINREYPLNKNWRLNRPDKDMKVEVNIGNSALDACDARRLREYFTSVSISSISEVLTTDNVINQECAAYSFTNYDEAVPLKLTVSVRLTKEDGALVQFNGVDGEVRIPELVLEAQGCFGAVVCNRWCNGKNGNEHKSGIYSLIQRTKVLTIKNNSQALRDFAGYVNSKQGSELAASGPSKDIKIIIEQPGDCLEPVKTLAGHFANIIVDGQPAENYIVTKEFGPYWGAFKLHFQMLGLKAEKTQYYDTQKDLSLTNSVYHVKYNDQGIDYLAVGQALQKDQFVCFHDTDQLVKIDEVQIQQKGDLRCVLQNAHYKDREHGFFSLLATVKKLTIENARTVEDLADYVDGKYDLNKNWKVEQLDENMQVTIMIESPEQHEQIIQRVLNRFKSSVVNGKIVAPKRLPNTCVNNKYIVQRELGRGAFGVAYLVKSANNGDQQYVLKEIDMSRMNNGEKIFIDDEIQALKRCNHRNVIRYEESFINKNWYCIVMEYCDGGDLEKLIEERKVQERPFTEEEVFRYFVQMCLAVKHVHDQKILHRDIKSANIFLAMPAGPDAKGPLIKLGDFGASKVNQVNLAQTYVGTPLFMAPEILQGSKRLKGAVQEYSNKCDIWSLGCVLYEMCMFQHIAKQDFTRLVWIVTQGEIPQVKKKKYPYVQDFINVMIRTNPNERHNIVQILRMILRTDQIRRWTEDLFKPEEIRQITAEVQPERQDDTSSATTSEESDEQLNTTVRRSSLRTRREQQQVEDNNFSVRIPAHVKQKTENAIAQMKRNMYDKYGEKQYKEWRRQIRDEVAKSRVRQDIQELGIPQEVIDFALVYDNND